MNPELVKDAAEQIELLKARPKEAHDRQKSYADVRRKDLSFEIGDEVYLKLRAFRGNDRHRKLKKLKPRYMGPYPVVERIGEVAYRLQLPQELSKLHDVFHISLLRKVVREPEFILSASLADLEGNLSVLSKLSEILEFRESKVDGKKTKLVKVKWERDDIREEMWEPEELCERIP
ncbi:uncharacterized protein LOC112089780 [Eutrema salsugineum]|uniref:uncharacterized protein LOC112089780 n=1 Tax=Eutrema salsugineum TaxID=72664 RepID=UPI000CECF69E|nr:uncharacterized protein LOC112089780 [Eutrema salsugineum]